MKKSSLVVLLIVGCALVMYAQKKPAGKTATTKPTERTSEVPSGKMIGMIFNDFTYIVQEPQAANPSKGTSGNNSFSFRRATIGYAYQYTKDISGLIVYDGSSNVLKQAYAELNNIGPLIDVKIGLSQTFSSDIVEKIWSYRSIDATVLDRKGLTNEFDMGLAVTGRTNAQGTMYARLAAYNGNGLVAENDKVKRYALSVGNWFDKSSVADLYVDYENKSGGRSSITAKAFYGMMASNMTFGAEGFYRLDRKFAGTKDISPAGASLFGWYEAMRSVRAILRVDIMDQDLNNEGNDAANPSYRELYLNVGADYFPVAQVHLIPNFGYTMFLKKNQGTEIAASMTFRLTTAVYFN